MQNFSTRLMFLICFLFGMFGLAAMSDCIAQDKTDKDVSKKRPAIKVPEPPAAKPVVPQPGGMVTLLPGYYAIIESEADFIVRQHPVGVLNINKKAYPKGLTIAGKFVGGSGIDEVKDFAGPYIAIVTTTNTAGVKVAVDAIPVGVETEADIASVLFVTGLMPNPPPGPIVPPGPVVPPGPIVPPTPVVTHPDAGFVILEDLDKRSIEDGLTFDFRKWDSLPIEGRYRFYSVKSPDAISKGYVKLWESTGKKLPIILAVKPDGSLIDSLAQPANWEEAKAFVARIIGAK